MGKKVSAEVTVKDIRRQTRRQGISQSLYYKWSKEFLEAGKSRLAGDTKRQASSDDVDDLREENAQLKQLVAELALTNRVLKKV